MSPVVLRKTTASKPRSRLRVNVDASSVALTEKPFARPRLRIDVMPAGIESWRNPAVLEKTSTRCRGSGFASGTLAQAIRPAAAIPNRAAPRPTAALAEVRIAPDCGGRSREARPNGLRLQARLTSGGWIPASVVSRPLTIRRITAMVASTQKAQRAIIGGTYSRPAAVDFAGQRAM